MGAQDGDAPGIACTVPRMLIPDLIDNGLEPTGLSRDSCSLFLLRGSALDNGQGHVTDDNGLLFPHFLPCPIEVKEW